MQVGLRVVGRLPVVRCDAQAALREMRRKAPAGLWGMSRASVRLVRLVGVGIRAASRSRAGRAAIRDATGGYWVVGCRPPRVRVPSTTRRRLFSPLSPSIFAPHRAVAVAARFFHEFRGATDSSFDPRTVPVARRPTPIVRWVGLASAVAPSRRPLSLTLFLSNSSLTSPVPLPDLTAGRLTARSVPQTELVSLGFCFRLRFILSRSHLVLFSPVFRLQVAPVRPRSFRFRVGAVRPNELN
jgi:hypothetical protein